MGFFGVFSYVCLLLLSHELRGTLCNATTGTARRSHPFFSCKLHRCYPAGIWDFHTVLPASRCFCPVTVWCSGGKRKPLSLAFAARLSGKLTWENWLVCSPGGQIKHPHTIPKHRRACDMVSICVSYYVHHVFNPKMTQVYHNLRTDRNSRTASHLQVAFEAWFVGSKFQIAVLFILILKSSFFQPLFTVCVHIRRKKGMILTFPLECYRIGIGSFQQWTTSLSGRFFGHQPHQATAYSHSRKLAAQPQPHKTAEPACGVRWCNHGKFRRSWSCLGDDVFHSSW